MCSDEDNFSKYSAASKMARGAVFNDKLFIINFEDLMIMSKEPETAGSAFFDRSRNHSDFHYNYSGRRNIVQLQETSKAS